MGKGLGNPSLNFFSEFLFQGLHVKLHNYVHLFWFTEVPKYTPNQNIEKTKILEMISPKKEKLYNSCIHIYTRYRLHLSVGHQFTNNSATCIEKSLSGVLSLPGLSMDTNNLCPSHLTLRIQKWIEGVKILSTSPFLLQRKSPRGGP